MKTLGRTLVRATVTATLVTACALGTTGVADATTDHWGAIAFSTASGHAGLSWDYRTRAAAAHKAARECGRSDCRAVVMVANGCAALAQAPNRALGVAYAASLRAAQRSAVAATPARGARVIGYVCTTGHA